MAFTPDSISLSIDPRYSRLLNMQREFQRMLYGGDAPSDLDDDKRMEYIRTQSLALTDELHEALAETGWKPWATSNHLNRDAYKGELADVFIFFMNLMLVADITSSEMAAAVEVKIAKNIKRQVDGYDGVSTKCPNCKRAYDDDAVKCHGDTGHGAWCEIENVIL